MFFKKKNDDNKDSQKNKGNSVKSRNWYEDRYQSMVVQRNILSLVSVISLIGVVACALVVQIISSLKTIEPFVIEISETSGIATVVDQLSVREFIADDMIVRYFLVSYMKARESFDINRYEHNYKRVVRLFSASSVYNEFARSVMSRSDDGIIEKFGIGRIREVKVLSITFLKKGPGERGRTAQIRYLLEDKNRDGRNKSSQNKVAIVNFDFVQLNLSIEDRYINPLGFQVISYVSDDEYI